VEFVKLDNNKKHGRTAVYIDGLNLYHGSLSRSAYKWLDIEKLCSVLLPQEKNIISISYFTALVKNTGLGDGLQRERQNIYLKALAQYCPNIEVIKGHFDRRKQIMQIAENTLCNTCGIEHDYEQSRVKVWRNEEKKTDVNLSVRIVHDAWKNLYDQAVVITNDTDITQALIAAREDCSPYKPPKKIGFISPTTLSVRERLPAKHLMVNSDWHKSISISHLEQSQLPDVIIESKLFKPKQW